MEWEIEIGVGPKLDLAQRATTAVETYIAPLEEELATQHAAFAEALAAGEATEADAPVSVIGELREQAGAAVYAATNLAGVVSQGDHEVAVTLAGRCTPGPGPDAGDTVTVTVTVA